MGVKISGMAAATSAADTDEVELNQSGTSKRAALSLVRKVKVRKNSAGSTYTRSRLNLIEGANVTLTVADDSTDDEIDVTIAASGGGGGGYTQGCGVPATSQSIANNAAQNVAFDGTEAYDTDSMHDTVTNNDRVTCNTNGLYLFSFYGVFASSATGTRYAQLSLNGTTSYGLVRIPALSGVPTPLAITMQIPMVAGDYVVVKVFQDSGGALNLTSGYVAAQRIG